MIRWKSHWNKIAKLFELPPSEEKRRVRNHLRTLRHLVYYLGSGTTRLKRRHRGSICGTFPIRTENNDENCLSRTCRQLVTAYGELGWKIAGEEIGVYANVRYLRLGCQRDNYVIVSCFSFPPSLPSVHPPKLVYSSSLHTGSSS